MKEKYVPLKAEMYHFETWVKSYIPDSLKVEFEQILKESKFTIVNFTEHHFPVEGYTCVWVLSESHLAIHTFPKNKKSYIQISSCNRIKLDLLKEKIKPLLYFSKF